MDRTEVMGILQENLVYCNGEARRKGLNAKEKRDWIRLLGYMAQVLAGFYKENEVEDISKRLERLENGGRL